MENLDGILCPSCGAKGKAVSRITVGSLIKPQIRPKIPLLDKFWFCPAPDCDTVYFAEDNTLFSKSDLSVKVGTKELDENSLLCYCFGYTKKMLLDELTSTGKPTIPDKIKEQIKRGNCYCDITNPEGSCCLGNITAFLNTAKSLKD